MTLLCACCRLSSSHARRCANFFVYSRSFSQKLPSPFRLLPRNPPQIRGVLCNLQRGKKMTTTTLVAPISLSNDHHPGAEWSPAHTRELLHLSADIKARPGRYASTLHGKFIALIFEKPSLRTRVTFEVGIQSMGGSVIFLDHTQASASLGARESIADVARNLDRWVQGIVARVYHQRVLEEMAANADIPVINALSDKFHPCQALADFFTLEE